MTTITMSQKEIDKMKVLIEIENKQIWVLQWARKLWISERQMIRVKKKYKERWERWLIHELRGKQGNRRIDERLKETVRIIFEENKVDYEWIGPTYLKEEVLEWKAWIGISKETLRQWMMEWWIWEWKNRKKHKTRMQRKRKDSVWEMIQFDGCYHVWFWEEVWCLLLAIDDATSKIMHAELVKNEGVVCVLQFWENYIKRHGRPKSIYLDKFATYKVNNIPTAVFEPEVLTQFQTICNDLWVEVIHAHSPQAKWRVERANLTLQDRFVKDLKFANIVHIDDARVYLENVYIPKHNQKFSVKPTIEGDMHKALCMTDEELYWIISLRSTRVVKNDFTIEYKTTYIQLEDVWSKVRPKMNVFIYKRYDTWDLKITNRSWTVIKHTSIEQRPKNYVDDYKEDQKKKLKEKKEKKKKDREKNNHKQSKERQREFNILKLVFFQNLTKNDKMLSREKALKQSIHMASEVLAWRLEDPRGPAVAW